MVNRSKDENSKRHFKRKKNRYILIEKENVKVNEIQKKKDRQTYINAEL